MLMLLSRMKNECFFFFFLSGESVNPFLLGAAYQSWRNQFSYSKTGSGNDVGKELHTFEITKYPGQPAAGGSRRNVDLVVRGEESPLCRRLVKAPSLEAEGQTTTSGQDPIRSPSRCLLTTRSQACARHWGARD